MLNYLLHLPPHQILYVVFLYYPYLKIYLPLIGGLFTGNKEAYQFLSASIMSFQSPEHTALMMKEAGFENVTTIHVVPPTFGEPGREGAPGGRSGRNRPGPTRTARGSSLYRMI